MSDPSAPSTDDRYELLKPYLTERRQARFEEVLDRRMDRVCVVVEDLFQPHNASAVVRSCDGFGVQNLHAIEIQNDFSVVQSVAKGAGKWIDLHHHNSVKGCFDALRKSGYRIAVTSPHADGYTPEDVPLDKPLAVVFGSEGPGASDAVLNGADCTIRIPMEGFTESFNISVAAALTLNDITRRVRRADTPWRLCKNTRSRLLGDWAEQTVKDAKNILEFERQRRAHAAD
jgi:tRNA (guanosine-2'-O-)-methyltransferase|tara:strand:- start:19 stop:708 length:690 start_codon:yes stop_codon:yes gene_type:complete